MNELPLALALVLVTVVLAVTKSGRDQRRELTDTFKAFSDTLVDRLTNHADMQTSKLEALSSSWSSFSAITAEHLHSARAESLTTAKQLREEIGAGINGFTAAASTTLGELATQQQTQLQAMSGAIGTLSTSTETKLDAVRNSVDHRLQAMQADNAKQLDQMRATVEEKLQSSLERRLGESFRQVSDRLEQVHRGLGEMQTLATGVGDLKKVLSNVKIRGTWGEVQLGAMLEDVLNPDQFTSNLAMKEGGERVDFAIRLPGHNADPNEPVWLPIDAKFPLEDYQRLIEAQEAGDVAAAESTGKRLEHRVRSCARDISAKYLNPPHTTDFGILFLPVEGLYAEVIRRPGLTETLQHDCRVIVAGPTTLWAILNSLQMGFRTLAIQQRSSEVWSLLAAVKTEWRKYGDVLDAVQKKLHQASNTIDKVKVRSRAVGRKLKEVDGVNNHTQHLRTLP